MKSGPNRSLLTAAMALVGLGTQANTTDNTLVLHPPPVTTTPRFLLHRSHPHLSQSPPYNQRKARKTRRQRFAAGDRLAFKR